MITPTSVIVAGGRPPIGRLMGSLKNFIDPDLVNVNGGAIAVGHPLGMSGARIALHAALEPARRGSGYGAAALCGAGGRRDVLILRAAW